MQFVCTLFSLFLPFRNIGVARRSASSRSASCGHRWDVPIQLTSSNDCCMVASASRSRRNSVWEWERDATSEDPDGGGGWLVELGGELVRNWFSSGRGAAATATVRCPRGPPPRFSGFHWRDPPILLYSIT